MRDHFTRLRLPFLEEPSSSERAALHTYIFYIGLARVKIGRSTRIVKQTAIQSKGSVSQVVTKGFLKALISSSFDIQAVIHFDADSRTLVVQDPQFIFYLRNLSWPALADEVGFVSMDFPSRYDFALSFAGSDRDIAEALFSALEENEMEVFYDRNEQHRILAEDVEEYLAPIYASDALLVVCILGARVPKRIWTKFESIQFKQRFKSGEVIPIVLNTAPLGAFDSAAKVGHIVWDRAKSFDEQVKAAADLLVQKCGEIRRRGLSVKAAEPV